jgi:PDZ domain-containing protein/aspartyl protease
MQRFWPRAALAALFLPAVSFADDAPKSAAKPREVPYRLTVPKHVLVRAKINGKGPFNFILDTGAPALFVATKVCAKLGIKPDARDWGVFDRFEIEGGVVLKGIKGRIEDPFQLEGMNGLGLAGAELHGIIGYNVLARYRMEIDFTRDKMTWTPLDFSPVAPAGMGGKASGSAGGLEVVGSIMKMLGAFMGTKATPEVAPRGFLGFDVADGEDNPVVRSVMEQGPAARAGVKVGDIITRLAGRGVGDRDDVVRLTKKLTAGVPVKLTVKRGDSTKELTLTTGEGL